MQLTRRIEGKLCKFSYSNEYLAFAVHNELCIQKTSSSKSMKFQCFHMIEDINWSFDSEFISCGQYSKGSIQIFSLMAPLWRFNLQSNTNISSTIWSPDSRHLITITSFMEYFTVWSLVKRTASFIESPKSTANAILKFSPNGKFLALLECQNNEDYFSVFLTSSWERSCSFLCSKLLDSVGGLSWCPDSNKICIWDNGLNCCRALIYSLAIKSVISTYSESETLRPSGIFSTSWSPAGQLLLLASYDNKIRVLNNVSWRPVMELDCGSVVNDIDCFVYQQLLNQPSVIVPSKTVHTEASFQLIKERPVNLLRDSNKSGYLLNWSYSGKYLAVLNWRYPNALRIWNMTFLSLHSIIIQQYSINDLKWSSHVNQLAVCFGKSVVTVWTEKNVQSISIPFLSTKGSLNLKKIEWEPRKSEYLCISSESEFLLMKV